ncbi:MAG: biopolymer transporter ExbD [Isosphaeraceae bacterium]|nr:biopolymer transporter ExbD [Isosphaeraceae bacterium]
MIRLRTLALVLSLAATALADDFDRLEGPILAGIPASGDAQAHEQLTLAELGNLPSILPGLREPLLIAMTDQGNIARLIAIPAFRKPQGGQGEPIPILVLERFATFEGGPATTRLARGRDLILFDGFFFDLDSGQVVPEGQGGDLRFLAQGEQGPRLVAVGKAKLYTLSKSPFPSPAAAPRARPSTRGQVRPEDFAGRYHLFADGRWSGVLDLKVGERGVVTGRFRSDQTGASYPVTGHVAEGAPHQIRFAAQFPRSKLEFVGYLWTEGQGAMAGSATLLDHELGFFALREGGHYAPEGEEVEVIAQGDQRPGRLEISIRPEGRFTVGGKDLDASALVATLKDARSMDPSTWVALHAPADLPLSEFRRALELIRSSAGGLDVRLAPVEPNQGR